jgi:hypothetical protein
MKRPENVTIVILSDEQAKELSVLHSLRCLVRDFRFLAHAFLRHGRIFCGTVGRGYRHVNHWWTWR